MDNIESYIWLFCLDHPDTNITRVYNFMEWIFATGKIAFFQGFFFSDIHHTSWFDCGHLLTEITNFNLLVPRRYRRHFARFYANSDSDRIAKPRAPWATSLRRHGALDAPTATLRRVSCDARSTYFRGDLTALVLNMFKTWRRPRRPWGPYCDLQRCHGALWDLTTTQRRSAAIWPILQIAARSPSCVTGVLDFEEQMRGFISWKSTINSFKSESLVFK